MGSDKMPLSSFADRAAFEELGRPSLFLRKGWSAHPSSFSSAKGMKGKASSRTGFVQSGIFAGWIPAERRNLSKL